MQETQNNNVDAISISKLVLLFQQGFDIFSHICHLEFFAVPFDWFPFGVDEKFLEIPGNVRPLYWIPNDEIVVSHEANWIVTGKWNGRFKELKQWVGTGAINLYF